VRNALPVHANGLTAIGFRRNGDPIWPVFGGSVDEPVTETPVEDDAGDGEEEAGDNPLGPAGEKALSATKEKYKTARATIREQLAELQELRTKVATGDDTAAQQREADFLKREAATLAAANQRILRAEVRAAAAGKLADPADAQKFIDLEQFEVDEDGELDQGEIAKAIADLVKSKPYLAAQGGSKAPKPDRRQGGGSEDATGSMAAGRAAYQARARKPQ
jgi:hypothetical protein